MAENPYQASQLRETPVDRPFREHAGYIVSVFCFTATILGHATVIVLGLQFLKLPGGVAFFLAPCLGVASGLFAGKGRRLMCTACNVLALVVPPILVAPRSFWVSLLP